MEYKLIAQNSDMTPACERAGSSFSSTHPKLPRAAAPLREDQLAPLLSHMPGPGILTIDVLSPLILFLDVLFWGLRTLEYGALLGVKPDFRNHPMLTIT